MEHWDVSTAFIHAHLKERVYMKQASGHEVKGKENYVYLLKKALYGTKQAAHAWQQHLRKLMEEEGYVALTLDPATYTKRKENAHVIVGTHVDDLFVVANTDGKQLRKQLWDHLASKLKIKTLGEPCRCLFSAMRRQASSNYHKNLL